MKAHWGKCLTSRLRQFLEYFAERYGIKKPEEWAAISNETLSKEGGSEILIHNSGSLYKALLNAFPGLFYVVLFIEILPETKWKNEWFIKTKPQKFWNEKENQKKFP